MLLEGVITGNGRSPPNFFVGGSFSRTGTVIILVIYSLKPEFKLTFNAGNFVWTAAYYKIYEKNFVTRIARYVKRSLWKRVLVPNVIDTELYQWLQIRWGSIISLWIVNVKRLLDTIRQLLEELSKVWSITTVTGQKIEYTSCFFTCLIKTETLTIWRSNCFRIMMKIFSFLRDTCSSHKHHIHQWKLQSYFIFHKSCMQWVRPYSKCTTAFMQNVYTMCSLKRLALQAKSLKRPCLKSVKITL